jgi:putative transposase
LYPVVFVDALRVKIRDEGTVRSKVGYLALGVLADGTRDILGVWIEQTEGAKFWMKVFTELKTRGCHDILIAVTDGLKGMSEAIEAVYPATTRQTCLVYLMRQSLDIANWKERKPPAAALRPIYTAPSADAAAEALTAFEASDWGPSLSDDRQGVATRVDVRDSVLRRSARGAPRHPHHQRARERARPHSQSHQDARALSER